MADERVLFDPEIYRRMVEQTRDYAMFYLDPQGRIMSWNAGAQRIKGYAPEEIIGRHFSTFYTQEAVQSGWPDYELKIAAKEGRFEDEGWRVRKDGTRFWANVVITALRADDGRLLGFSKITRDLTERMLHEEALRQSEERFRLLVEGVVDYAIFLLDEEGAVTSWNTGAERIHGYSREEILGKHFSRFYSDADAAGGKPWQALAAARHDGRAEDEGWRVRKSGERFWARVVLTGLHDSQGHLRGFAKVTQDLTERRHLQDLEKATRNTHEFIAMLAHELRNPLAPIRNAVEVMARVPPHDPTHQAMRQTIERQSAQLKRIVDDLLDIARITRGSITLERTRVGLAEVVQRALEMAAPLIDAARHAVSVDLPPEPLVVEGDAARLIQLIGNLLNNAVRYTPQRGSIAVKVAAEGGEAVVRVRDTGRGIDPRLASRIFDMFVQGRSPLERVGGGLGVGLALARRIAELHGGTLEAASEGEDRGSEFTLRLPLALGGPAPAERRAKPPALVAARRILVVDDNVDAAQTLELLLGSLGHETAVAHDGVQALKLAVDFRPDLVLLDIGMPGMDGYEVARRLRALRSKAPLRIVAITGWGQESDRQRSREAGFDLHLVKPVDAASLARALADENGKNGPTVH